MRLRSALSEDANLARIAIHEHPGGGHIALGPARGRDGAAEVDLPRWSTRVGGQLDGEDLYVRDRRGGVLADERLPGDLDGGIAAWKAARRTAKTMFVLPASIAIPPRGWG